MPILDNPLRVAVYDEGTAYVVAAFASWIWELGHARLVVQGDGELAILALVAAFRDKVNADGKAEQIVCQTSPKGHTSPTELQIAPYNRCEGWRVSTWNTSVRIWICVSSELTLVAVGAASRSVDVQPTSCAGRHADNTVFPNQAQDIRSTFVIVWRIGSGSKARRAFAEQSHAVCVRLLVWRDSLIDELMLVENLVCFVRERLEG